jgi:sugar phosphate isomerase/epimerase
MVHFAVSSMFFHGYPLAEGFDHIEEIGFDAIEFWMETPYFWIRGCPVPELLSLVQAHAGLVFTVHAPVLDLNPCSINPRVAEASCTYALESIQLAERLGSSVVTVHPGRRTVKRVPSWEEYERLERYFTLLRKAAAASSALVSMENMEPKVNALLCTPEGMRELLDREPWCHFTLDLSHALAGSIEAVYRYLDLCSERLVNVHLSRVDGGRLHFPLDWDDTIREMLEYLRDIGYQGHLTLEIEDRNFAHDLSLEERIVLLGRELDFLHAIFS